MPPPRYYKGPKSPVLIGLSLCKKFEELTLDSFYENRIPSSFSSLDILQRFRFNFECFLKVYFECNAWFP